jgi:hypothetical protein
MSDRLVRHLTTFLLKAGFVSDYEHGRAEAEAFASEYARLAGPGVDGAVVDSIRAALSTDRHRLVRNTSGGVVCTCGLYGDSAAGDVAAEAWRGHLIDAAVVAFTDLVPA